MHTVSNKHTLVYIDDDEDDLLMVQQAFSTYQQSIEVRTFNSGKDGYSYLLSLEQRGSKPCLVLLDLNMPAMSGRELLPILRAIPFFEDVPVVLFTTSSSQHDYRFALQYDAGFLTKPMTFQQMDVIADQFLSYCTPSVKEHIRKEV